MEKGEGKEKEEQKSDVAFSLPPPALFYSFFWERRIERREFEREREMREVSRERDREDNDEEEKRGRKEKVFLLFGCLFALVFVLFYSLSLKHIHFVPFFAPFIDCSILVLVCNEKKGLFGLGSPKKDKEHQPKRREQRKKKNLRS